MITLCVCVCVRECVDVCVSVSVCVCMYMRVCTMKSLCYFIIYNFLFIVNLFELSIITDLLRHIDRIIFTYPPLPLHTFHALPHRIGFRDP